MRYMITILYDIYILLPPHSHNDIHYYYIILYLYSQNWILTCWWNDTEKVLVDMIFLEFGSCMLIRFFGIWFVHV